MANDHPTSLRMGFGFQQARAAGAPYRNPRAPSSVNLMMKERAAGTEIERLVVAYPQLKSQFIEIATAQKYKSNQPILSRMKTVIRDLRRAERWKVLQMKLAKKAR